MENQTYLNDNLNYTLFPWLKQKGLKPIHLDHAEGSYLYSNDGKRYIDFSSQLFNVSEIILSASFLVKSDFSKKLLTMFTY